MSYNEKEARELVIKAGHELIDRKLIARTWGNISARISDTEFVITPSGRAYDGLKPNDLVKVRISDLSYDGDVKPSSEKGIHADAYALRPETEFIIHTHQLYATAISVEGKDTDFAPCAGYGLPGTKTLRNQVTKTLKKYPSSDAILMQRHGVLCLGMTYESAFERADLLEQQSKALFDSNSSRPSDRNAKKPWVDDYAQMFGYSGKPVDDDPEALQLLTQKNMAAAAYVKDAAPMSPGDVLIQHLVFKFKYSKLK